MVNTKIPVRPTELRLLKGKAWKCAFKKYIPYNPTSEDLETSSGETLSPSILCLKQPDSPPSSCVPTYPPMPFPPPKCHVIWISQANGRVLEELPHSHRYIYLKAF